MSSLSMAGDYSGLTATGRPISGGQLGNKRQMSRYVRSMFSQHINAAGSSPSRGAYNSGNHGNLMKSSSGYGYHYARQMSSSRSVSHTPSFNVERPASSVATETATFHHRDEPSSGKFVANFFQTQLSRGGVDVGGAKSGQGRAEKEERAVSEMTRYLKFPPYTIGAIAEPIVV